MKAQGRKIGTNIKATNMKYNYILICSCLFLMATACDVNELLPTRWASESVIFHASSESGIASKTTLQADGSIMWNVADSIDIFVGNGKYAFASLNTSMSSSCDFGGTLEGVTWDDTSEFWAVYPHKDENHFDGEFVYTNLPDEQDAEEGSFSDDLFISIAKSQDFNLFFYNVCGGVKFSVTEPGIQSVTFKGNNNEPLSGKAKICFDSQGIPVVDDILEPKTEIVLQAKNGSSFEVGKWYYIVCYPATLDQGYELSFTKDDGTKAEKFSSAQVSIKRATWGRITNSDEGLEYRDWEQDREREREALLTLWRTLDGENWSPEYWDPLSSWKEENPIEEWKCLDFTEKGTLRLIDISGEYVKGPLPDVFDSFKDLEWIRISSSNLSGVLPPSIGRLGNLKELRIRGGVSGPLPDLSGLQSIESMSLDGASFFSPIPASIGKLKNLKRLYCYHCALNGPIPEEIGCLEQLEELNLSTNYLEGELPQAICNLKNLKILNLESNLLTGNIPEEICKLESLEELILRGHSGLQDYENQPEYTNSFSGPIPASIGSMQKLKCLDLEENHLTGGIPDELYELTNIESIDLGFNDLSGEISEKIATLQQLQYLGLTSNNLSGPLPDGLWTLRNLRGLALGNYYTHYNVPLSNKNSFTGGISSNISNLVNLEMFHATNCNLSGIIPLGLTTLRNLYSLTLNENNLTGTVPDEFKDLDMLSTLWLQGNKLSGYISEAFSLTMTMKNRYSSLQWILEPQQNGYDFFYELYESTDYCRHKEVKILNKATKGRGIDIVLLGDGFIDTEIKDGTYDSIMNGMYEGLFALEPFKSFQDYFNVYEITLVSKNNSVNGETALNVKPDPLTIYEIDRSALMAIIDEVIPGLNHDDLTVSIATPFASERGGCCWLVNPTERNSEHLGLGIGISCFMDDMDSFQSTVRHEVVGHAFGKLADEYVDRGIYSTIDEYERDLIVSYHDRGWYQNIDIISDPDSILWHKFLGIQQYVDSGVGIYQGGYHSTYGVWRPSSESIMRTSNRGVFNAPSREAIFKRIQNIAFGEGSYDFSVFLEWDKKNLSTTQTQMMGYSSIRTYNAKLDRCVNICD